MMEGLYAAGNVVGGVPKKACHWLYGRRKIVELGVLEYIENELNKQSISKEFRRIFASLENVPKT